MPADTAKYILHITDTNPENIEVIDFSGSDAVSSLYEFNINVRMSGAAKASKAAPLDKGILGKPCRLDIIRNGEVVVGRPIPFMKGRGLAEITETGNVVESINRILALAKLMPKDVRIRAYNYRTPESAPDGISDVTGGHEGRIYEHGGKARNSSEAEHRATLYARRLWVEGFTLMFRVMV